MLHVRGAAVRFVHVPGRLDPNAAIVAHRKRVAEAAKSARRQHDAGQHLCSRTRSLSNTLTLPSTRWRGCPP